MAMTIDPNTGKFVPIQAGGGQFDPLRGAVGMGYGGNIPNFQMGPGPRRGKTTLGPRKPQVVSSLVGPAPKGTRTASAQPLKGKYAKTKRTGGKPAMGQRAGIGGYEGPYYGGKPMFSAAARAKLRPGSSLASQMRQLQGGRTGGARTLLSRGRLDPMSKMQMGHAGFPGRRQVRSFISGGRR